MKKVTTNIKNKQTYKKKPTKQTNNDKNSNTANSKRKLSPYPVYCYFLPWCPPRTLWEQEEHSIAGVGAGE